ncbi:Aristolochene synthase in complex with 12,13-Difluorofarnesyl diphosphate [Xylariaceae sp. FL0594]|nr:Aristolochene synthase in complex with 12,13-Difluorofarnesyl diphosphate [Xylariaceae sp. FL0594]
MTAVMQAFEPALGKEFGMKTMGPNDLTTPPRSGRATPDSESSFRIPPVPESYLKPSWYHNMDAIIREVDQYFLDRWDFPSEKERKKFVVAGFSRVTCMYYPMADDDRIGYACKLLTILFLIDDLLEDMSFEDGEAYNNALMPIMRGEQQPNRSSPAEAIMWDLWTDMRALDHDLADEILEPTFVFMRAQTDRERKKIKGFGSYLIYRERDVGKALLSALMRFSMGLHLTPQELAMVRPVDENCSKHISIINDIFSWEKELAQSFTGHEEGSVLCSSVQVLAEEANLTIEASKRVLFAMAREWELTHLQLAAEIEADPSLTDESRAAVMSYVKGLEYQMSGNELWSASTLRYIGAGATTTTSS